MPYDRRGYSLIELPVAVAAIAIIAVLSLLAIASNRGVGARAASERAERRSNLKQIGIALAQYADDHGRYPPAFTVDADGRPLHSWRTLILPSFDQAALAAKIDLSTPWDSPANAEYAKMQPL